MLIGTWMTPVINGALVLPAPFRPAVAAGVTITRSLAGCLQVFPTAGWQQLAQQVSALPLTLSAARTLRRVLFSAATPLAPSPEGLIQLPATLLARAAIMAEATLVGMGSYFEIWAPARWQV
ncbi:MAG: division/cell wall cluster transcriptional repressor MraZ [Oscillochloridaceae bacterium umkhey_bin13]